MGMLVAGYFTRPSLHLQKGPVHQSRSAVKSHQSRKGPSRGERKRGSRWLTAGLLANTYSEPFRKRVDCQNRKLSRHRYEAAAAGVYVITSMRPPSKQSQALEYEDRSSVPAAI